MDQDYDVIVIGAGGSGLAAAVWAAKSGGRVLVMEKQPQPGGTTGIAVGSFTAAGTSLQRQAGVQDSKAAHIEDVRGFAPPAVEARNAESLRAFFLEEAAATFEWLRSLGLSFVGPSPEPPNRQPRMHNVVPGAKAYIAALQLAVNQAGSTLVCNATVESLLRQGERVVGVQASVQGKLKEYRANRGVILAAGDYANNPRMIGHFKGQQYCGIEGINPAATGDGHRLAETAGAELVNMDVTYGPELRFVASGKRPFQQWLPATGPVAGLLGTVAGRLPKWVMRRMIKRLLVTWQHPENSLFDDGAVLLNRSGQRFVSETSYPDREIAVAAQPDKVAYILLDGRLSQRYSAWPHFISTAPDIAYAYVADYMRLRKDVTVTGSQLEQVARRAGLDEKAVRESVAAFNRSATGEHPDAYGRAGNAEPLVSGPWVLLGPVKAYFTTTEGGAAIDRQMRVLDGQGRPIPGLYAAGQNGLAGMILWSHGLHIAWAITSGRLAGQAIMQDQVP